MNRLKTFLINLKSLHHRLMAWYLRRRNWVVFYLEPQYRKCRGGVCWLELYENEMKVVSDGQIIQKPATIDMFVQVNKGTEEITVTGVVEKLEQDNDS